MNTVEIIRKKRDANVLTGEEIHYLIEGYTKGSIPDYQFSAFLMAGFLNGFNEEETSSLTKEMLYSGIVVDLSGIPGKKVDKHSTGGVGDKTSLILAPIVAAAGVKVPMISGRGLGHTGGTLDKLESIPGFRTDLNLDEYKKVISETGAVLIGQTKEIAPADKLIYSLRDVTGTVESIPFITASIMSKKLAEGIDGLVLDVKTGSGAFMRKFEDSKKLAESLINTAKAFDKDVMAFITDMNQPLGKYIGNWLEVYECVLAMQGEDIPDLMEVTYNLSGGMLLQGGKVQTLEEGIELSKEMIKSGKAFDKFLQMTGAHGGDVSFLKEPEKYEKSKFSDTVTSGKEGYITEIDNYKIGMASLTLGAGRRTKEDVIDPKAGIIFYPEIGDKISVNGKLADLYTDSEEALDQVKQMILEAVTISEKPVPKTKIIHSVLR